MSKNIQLDFVRNIKSPDAVLSPHLSWVFLRLTWVMGRMLSHLFSAEYWRRMAMMLSLVSGTNFSSVTAGTLLVFALEILRSPQHPGALGGSSPQGISKTARSSPSKVLGFRINIIRPVSNKRGLLGLSFGSRRETRGTFELPAS